MVWKLRYSNITSDCRYKRLSSLAKRQKCFDQPVRNNLIIYDSVQKTGTGEGDITQLVISWTTIISKTIIRWWK